MVAVDTSILVRLIARDDPDQYARACALVETHTCFVPDTVLVELAWVLRSSYGADPAQIRAELLAVLGLPTVRVEDPDRVRRALDWYADGLAFTDAMHLASARHAARMVTFDRACIDRARGKGDCPVVEP